MRRNPKALMEVIPSPRPVEKIKAALGPRLTSMKNQLRNEIEPVMPPLHISRGKPRKFEKDHSQSGSQYSRHTTQSMKRRRNPNSTKMVVIKPVPIAQGK